MYKYYLMAHDWQFELLRGVFDFDDSISRIDYDNDLFFNALNHSSRIFIFVSDADHDKFMNIALLNKQEDKVVSLINAYSFYTQLSQIFPKKMKGMEYIKYLTFYDLFPREHYAYGLTVASEVAMRMNIDTISAIEFGVCHGRGLLAMSSVCQLITSEIGLNFKVFGFDTGNGLPSVADWRDHSELWYTGDMVMPNIENLKNILPENCELIIGDIKDTLSNTVSKIFDKSLLGFVSIDVDTYSSTKACLDVFTGDHDSYLPVIPTWVDDSYVNIFQTNFAGEALAINEFNNTNLRKIDRKIIRTNRPSKLWYHCYYFTHIFDHTIRNSKNDCNFCINHCDF